MTKLEKVVSLWLSIPHHTHTHMIDITIYVYEYNEKNSRDKI